MLAWHLRLTQSLIGAIFLYAALSKAFDSQGIAKVLLFLGVGEAWIAPVVIVVLAAEAVVGSQLLLLPRSPLLMRVAGFVLALFSGLLIYLLPTESAPACGCMGKLLAYETARTQNAWSLARNLVLIAAAVPGMFTLKATGTPLFSRGSAPVAQGGIPA